MWIWKGKGILQLEVYCDSPGDVKMRARTGQCLGIDGVGIHPKDIQEVESTLFRYENKGNGGVENDPRFLN